MKTVTDARLLVKCAAVAVALLLPAWDCTSYDCLGFYLYLQCQVIRVNSLTGRCWHPRHRRCDQTSQWWAASRSYWNSEWLSLPSDPVCHTLTLNYIIIGLFITLTYSFASRSRHKQAVNGQYFTGHSSFKNTYWISFAIRQNSLVCVKHFVNRSRATVNADVRVMLFLHVCMLVCVVFLTYLSK